MSTSLDRLRAALRVNEAGRKRILQLEACIDDQRRMLEDVTHMMEPLSQLERLCFGLVEVMERQVLIDDAMRYLLLRSPGESGVAPLLTTLDDFARLRHFDLSPPSEGHVTAVDVPERFRSETVAPHALLLTALEQLTVLPRRLRHSLVQAVTATRRLGDRSDGEFVALAPEAASVAVQCGDDGDSPSTLRRHFCSKCQSLQFALQRSEDERSRVVSELATMSESLRHTQHVLSMETAERQSLAAELFARRGTGASQRKPVHQGAHESTIDDTDRSFAALVRGPTALPAALTSASRARKCTQRVPATDATLTYVDTAASRLLQLGRHHAQSLHGTHNSADDAMLAARMHANMTRDRVMESARQQLLSIRRSLSPSSSGVLS